MHHETVDENRSDSTGIGRIEHRAKRNVEDHEVRHSARAHPPWRATGLLRGTQIRRECRRRTDPLRGTEHRSGIGSPGGGGSDHRPRIERAVGRIA